MLPYPQHVIPNSPAYTPLTDLLDSVLVGNDYLSSHWGYSENHLSNLRRLQKGPPWVKLPTGAIRYRLSEIFAAEVAGTRGALTTERVALAMASCKTVPAEHRAAMIAHLETVFPTKK